MKKVKRNFTYEYMSERIEELAGRCDHRTLVIWAADCAQHVLKYYEDRFPNDERPGKAIEGARAWVRGEIMAGEARKLAFASHSAARKTGQDPVSLIARAAGHAVAAAHVSGHAFHAATYAVRAIENIFGSEAANREREWQYDQLLTSKTLNIQLTND